MISAHRPGRRRTVAALAAAPLALAGPRAAGAIGGWPPITDEPGDIRHGAWVWRELLCADPDAAGAFYARAFGWQVARRGTGARSYRLARHDGRPIAGMLRIDDARDGTAPAARWIGWMSVPDVDAAVRRATDGGGRVLVPSALRLGRGRTALLADPEGAVFGVMRAVDGDPPDRDPVPGEWLWQELWAGDGARMAAWYRDLGNTTIRRVAGDGDRDDWVLVDRSGPRAGVIDKPVASVASAWLPYLHVADLDGALKAVVDAGGRVLVEPSPRRRAGRVAIVSDVAGAPLGLVRWSGETTR